MNQKLDSQLALFLFLSTYLDFTFIFPYEQNVVLKQLAFNKFYPKNYACFTEIASRHTV